VKLRLWRDDATLARPVAAAGERHDRRPRLFLEVEHDSVRGYGEIGAQPAALNGDPSVDAVTDELTARTLPELAEITRREGEPPDWSRVFGLRGEGSAGRFAAALAEMALLDLTLRVESTSLRAAWPAHFATPAIATVSLLDEEPWELDAAAARLRVKTRPGPLSTAGTARLAAAGLPVLLDFNGSAHDAGQVVEQVDALADAVRLVAVEQPFAVGRLGDHAALARRIGVAVSLDEEVREARDLEEIARTRAAAMVCVKPARVGGVATARALIARAGELGLSAYLGGFFESTFARGVHRILAENAVREASDLLAVARELGGAESLEVPDGLGVAPSPGMLGRARPLVSLG
jgi:O-succinylbenzoate synthase